MERQDRRDRVGTHATTVKRVGGKLSVVYHNTEVVNATRNKIILDTGGWKSNTTKTRMNQASNEHGLDYNVFQKKGEWFAKHRGQTHKFKGDRLVLNRRSPIPQKQTPKPQRKPMKLIDDRTTKRVSKTLRKVGL